MEFPLFQFMLLVLFLDVTGNSLSALVFVPCSFPVPQFSFLQSKQSELTKPFLVWKMLQSQNKRISMLEETFKILKSNPCP